MTADRPAPDLLTITEVVARTGEPRWKVRTWVERGLLPIALRDGAPGHRRVWVRWSDVRAFGEAYYRGKPRPAWLDEPDR